MPGGVRSGARRAAGPWALVAGVLATVLLGAGIVGYEVTQDRAEHRLDAWQPTPADPDPSTRIPGVVVLPYAGGERVRPDQRVAYLHSPPFGGAHDGYWAACDGAVYPTAVRSEAMVAALAHGAVWIAYDPRRVTGDEVAALAAKVTGRTALMLSPYPGLDRPISLQSWGHQLKLSDPADPRVDEFVAALRANPYRYPETDTSCEALGPGRFDPADPPPFRPVPPAVAVDDRTVVPEGGVDAGS